MNDILTVSGLTKSFGSKQALDQIGFSLQPGRVAGLMGPNRAGKTTLFKSILQVYHPDQGEILICGEKAGPTARRLISYMPERNHLHKWMRIRDAIQYYSDMFPDFDRSRATELSAFLQLDKGEKIQTLSAGTLQRVLIMLTFARKAPLYLLDEPIGGIDPLARDKIIKTILAAVSEDSAVLISTHLVKDVETVVDDLLFLYQGRLLLTETAENIRLQRGLSIEECYLEVFANA